MKKGLYQILENRPLTRDIFQMTLAGETDSIKAPGQFINIALSGFYLRRPISICDWTDSTITILYKVVGKGTAYMKTLPAGESLDILTGLGNGFDMEKGGDAPLLIGGGVGVPPLYGLAKRLIENGRNVSVILGFNTKYDIFYADTFQKLGAAVIVTTADGSAGKKGFVTDALEEAPESSFLYTCGPEAMLRAIYEKSALNGQFSFEERMGCGFGACMGCSCQTIHGYKRICKEGPVLERGEILW